MSLEKRKNKLYHYSKRRENRRVISTYLGSTLPAEFSDLDQIENQVEQVELLITALTNAVLIASGYHKHKSQWRKKRVRNKLPHAHRPARTK